MAKPASIKLDLSQGGLNKNNITMVRKSSDLNKDTFRGAESHDPGEGQPSIGIGPIISTSAYGEGQDIKKLNDMQLSSQVDNTDGRLSG